jgi:hypothetical protein
LDKTIANPVWERRARPKGAGKAQATATIVMASPLGRETRFAGREADHFGAGTGENDSNFFKTVSQSLFAAMSKTSVMWRACWRCIGHQETFDSSLDLLPPPISIQLPRRQPAPRRHSRFYPLTSSARIILRECISASAASSPLPAQDCSGTHAKHQLRIGDHVEGLGIELRIRDSKPPTSSGLDFLVVSLGCAGDTYPILAAAIELRNRGHRVRFVGNSRFAPS